LLKEANINLDDVELLTSAFHLALHELLLVDRNDDPLCDFVARKVIEVGTDGTCTRDAQEIASRAVKQIGVLR
jgi:hypothetical protein